MDKKFIDAFLAGTVDVIKTMAFIETRPGEPYMKNDNVASGDISGIIGLTGGVIGSLALSFSEACILRIVSNMLGEELTTLNHDIEDAVGEITNMASGGGRKILANGGLNITAAIPTVVVGRNHTFSMFWEDPALSFPAARRPAPLWSISALWNSENFAVFAWGIHASLPQEVAHRDLLVGSTYVILSGVLIFSSFFKAGRTCPPAGGHGIAPCLQGSRPVLVLLTLGLATGLNFCPPFLLAVATAARTGNPSPERPVLSDLFSGHIGISHPGAVPRAVAGVSRPAGHRKDGGRADRSLLSLPRSHHAGRRFLSMKTAAVRQAPGKSFLLALPMMLLTLMMMSGGRIPSAPRATFSPSPSRTCSSMSCFS